MPHVGIALLELDNLSLVPLSFRIATYPVQEVPVRSIVMAGVALAAIGFASPPQAALLRVAPDAASLQAALSSPLADLLQPGPASESRYFDGATTLLTQAVAAGEQRTKIRQASAARVQELITGADAMALVSAGFRSVLPRPAAEPGRGVTCDPVTGCRVVPVSETTLRADPKTAYDQAISTPAEAPPSWRPANAARMRTAAEENILFETVKQVLDYLQLGRMAREEPWAFVLVVLAVCGGLATLLELGGLARLGRRSRPASAPPAPHLVVLPMILPQKRRRRRQQLRPHPD
jgi:hypothetical protein